ncbi:hypothetical protein M1349_02105 [Patescibacteria group bacterium]|nr:hypothetical protein [Patescibacteria group bacterium]
MRIKLVVISLFVIFGASLFYWYQIRPAQIKHDCSWVKMHSDAIPARVGMNEEELKAKGMIKSCPPETDYHTGIIQPLSDPFNGLACRMNNQDIIDKNKPQKYVPAKDWTRKATKDEYAFCLHDKGL